METCCGYEYGRTRESNAPSDFHGLAPAHRTLQEVQRFAGRATLSRGKPIPGDGPVKKKRELFPELSANVSEFACVAAAGNGREDRTPYPRSGSGILTRFPFGRRRRGRAETRARARLIGVDLALRTDSPMSNCCSHGTFPHFSLQSSHLNSCYYHQDLHRRRFDPGSRPGLLHHRRALLHVGTDDSPRRPGVGATLQRHPFSGLVDSAGELLHTP